MLSFLKRLTGTETKGLALGGGAVLGAAHVGVLRALEEMEVDIDFISGTSIGSLVAAFFAFGWKWKEIEAVARDLKWLDITRFSLSQYGLLSNERLEDLIIKELGKVDIRDALIPLSIVATDIVKGKKVVLESGSVAHAVMASTCIPGVFIPVEHGDTLLVDGGVVENVPITPLRERGADRVIAVELNAIYGEKRPENIIDVLVNTFDLSLYNVTMLQIKRSDILISPDLGEFNPTDTDQVPELVERGYRDGLAALKREKRKL